jgi:hypothetical protein
MSAEYLRALSEQVTGYAGIWNDMNRRNTAGAGAA